MWGTETGTGRGDTDHTLNRRSAYTFVVVGLLRAPRVLAVGMLLCILTSWVVAADDLRLVDSKGEATRWLGWLEINGPTAVLVWSSWAPEGDVALQLVPALAEAAAGRDLGFVVVDVQEGFEAAENALAGRGIEWLHDRHGAILKEYRLIEVPILVIVDSEGRLEARLSPDPGAVAAWAK